MSEKLTRAEYQRRASPCCGRKPLIYMRGHFQFCPKCDRAYDLDTEKQIGNWAWERDVDRFRPYNHTHERASMPGRLALANHNKGEG